MADPPVGRRILVVDDDPDILDYLSSLLEDHGYAVRTAASADAALAALPEFAPHAVLVDALMPGRSGLDLLVRVRRDPSWEHVPIVVVTGSDTILEDDCQSYLGSHHGVRGPDGVLGKPVDPGALLAVVRHLTSAQACGDAAVRSEGIA